MDAQPHEGSMLAGVAACLASEGRWVEAEALYREAITHALHSGQVGLAGYQMQLGMLLAQQGADGEAEEYLGRALRAAIATRESEPTITEGLARHALASFLCSRGRYDEALAELEPGLVRPSRMELSLRMVEVEALRMLGEDAAADASARRALTLVASPLQRQRLREMLATSRSPGHSES